VAARLTGAGAAVSRPGRTGADLRAALPEILIRAAGA
jgi:hypothetical protein